MTIAPKESFVGEAIEFGYLAGTRIAHIAQMFQVSHGSHLARVEKFYWHHACAPHADDQMTDWQAFPFIFERDEAFVRWDAPRHRFNQLIMVIRRS
jgi:hypothetical protein